MQMVKFIILLRLKYLRHYCNDSIFISLNYYICDISIGNFVCPNYEEVIV